MAWLQKVMNIRCATRREPEPVKLLIMVRSECLLLEAAPSKYIYRYGNKLEKGCPIKPRSDNAILQLSFPVRMSYYL